MSSRERNLESMLFNYETTGRTDYRNGEIKPIITTKYKKKSPCLRIRPPPLKDLHALTDWEKPIVPFNLMHRPKAIVQTNPLEIQSIYKKPLDLELARARKTRPRYVMTPALSLDDIEDRDVRKMLVEDVYTTTDGKTALNVADATDARSVSNIRAPVSPILAPANPIMLHKLDPPYVSPEWRMETVSWDGRQLRAFCEPTKKFWLARPPK